MLHSAFWLEFHLLRIHLLLNRTSMWIVFISCIRVLGREYCIFIVLVIANCMLE